MNFHRQFLTTFLAVLASVGFTSAIYAAPDITIDDLVWDFGDIDYKGEATHTFTIRNVGDETLEITDVKKACGCTTPELSTREIAPGAQGTMTIGYDTTRKGKFDKTVTLTTNDPDEEKVIVRIRGDVRTEVEVNPQRLFYGNVFRKEDNKRLITVSSPTLGTDIEVTGVETDTDMVSTRIIPSEKEGVINVEVVLSKDAPMGQLRDKITLKTNSEKMGTVEVPVIAMVYGDVEVNPARMYFSPAQKSANPTAVVTLKSRSDAGFQILGVEDDQSSIKVDIETVKEGQEYKLTATVEKLPATARRGYFNGKLLVKTNMEDEPTIEVPYNGYIQPEQLASN